MTKTNKEKSVEEILEEFESTFRGCDQCQYGNGQGEWIERWLTQTLQAERQKREEVVEAERVAIGSQIKAYHKAYVGDELEKKTFVIGVMNLAKALTQPNNK